MIKNITRPILLLIILTAFITGCKKEKIYPTTGEVAAEELQRAIQQNAVLRVYPVKYNQLTPGIYPANGGTTWSFSNGFIRVNYGQLQSYNLSYMVGYAVENVSLTDGSSIRALLIYME